MKKKPLLVFTLGDPAGVGPKVSIETAQNQAVLQKCRPLLIGDPWVVRRYLPQGKKLNILSHIKNYSSTTTTIPILDIQTPQIKTLKFGKPQKVGGLSAIRALKTAVDLALKKEIAAVVTAPVSKESLKRTGVSFPGHTEILSYLSGGNPVEMVMLAGPLKTVLLTRHLPLKKVSSHLTRKKIEKTILLVDLWLNKLHKKRKPQWGMCGLNPHAGDNGLLGREEKKIIRPAVKNLLLKGINIEGPLSADVVWSRHHKGEFDAVACPTHDQGMIPLKTIYPNRVVNITVGLSWIRTSPGHGTAFDLSKQNFKKADATATTEAALWALKLAKLNT